MTAKTSLFQASSKFYPDYYGRVFRGGKSVDLDYPSLSPIVALELIQALDRRKVFNTL